MQARYRCGVLFVDDQVEEAALGHSHGTMQLTYDITSTVLADPGNLKMRMCYPVGCALTDTLHMLIMQHGFLNSCILSGTF